MSKLKSNLKAVLGTKGQLTAQKINSPLFVTGSMRSGTTLLVNLLTAHPQLLNIGYGSELNEVWDKIGGANILHTCDYKSKEDANGEHTYQMGNYFQQCVNDSKSLKRHLMRAKSVWNKKISRVNYDWENIVPVNKSTHLMNKVDYVSALFPKSKFIFIIRDIYSHCASMKIHFEDEFRTNGNIFYFPEDTRSCWTTINKNTTTEKYDVNNCFPENFGLIPKMWIRLNKLALESFNNNPSTSFIIIRYEDLVSKQNETLQKVFDFLDLKAEHQQETGKIINTNITYKNTTTTGNPLNKWKKNLTPNEINTIESVISEHQEDYDAIIKSATTQA